MKEFDVTITETLKRTITVTAATKDEAEDLVRRQWEKGEHILDADDFTEVHIATDRQREIKPSVRGQLAALTGKEPAEHPALPKTKQPER